jgi:hypothetical protein
MQIAFTHHYELHVTVTVIFFKTSSCVRRRELPNMCTCNSQGEITSNPRRACAAGNFSVYPSLMARLFGRRHVGPNFGTYARSLLSRLGHALPLSEPTARSTAGAVTPFVTSSDRRALERGERVAVHYHCRPAPGWHCITRL